MTLTARMTPTNRITSADRVISTILFYIFISNDLMKELINLIRVNLIESNF